MLIGIDASRANRLEKTGTEWYSYHLIRALAAMDSKNSYVLYSDKPLVGGLVNLGPRQGFEDEENTKIKGGRQIIKSPHNNFSAQILGWPFKNFWTLGRLSWEMLLRPPDVLFIPAHTLPLIYPKRSVVTIHDLAYLYHKKVYEKASGGFNYDLKHLIWSTKRALKKTRRLITVSETTKKDILKEYASEKRSLLAPEVLEKKIKVVHHGYEKEIYFKASQKPLLPSLKQRFNLKKPYLAYLGRVEEKKGIVVLVKALALLRQYSEFKDLELCLIGKAGSGFEEIKEKISELKLGKVIHLTGWLGEEEAASLLAHSKAFVYPSLYEGFGLPILQAMAAGVPAVASRVGAIPEVAQEAAVLFTSQNEEELKESLLKILSDKEFRETMIKKGLVRSQAFSWERCAMETLRVLEDQD